MSSRVRRRHGVQTLPLLHLDSGMPARVTGLQREMPMQLVNAGALRVCADEASFDDSAREAALEPHEAVHTSCEILPWSPGAPRRRGAQAETWQCLSGASRSTLDVAAVPVDAVAVPESGVVLDVACRVDQRLAVCVESRTRSIVCAGGFVTRRRYHVVSEPVSVTWNGHRPPVDVFLINSCRIPLCILRWLTRRCREESEVKFTCLSL